MRTTRGASGEGLEEDVQVGGRAAESAEGEDRARRERPDSDRPEVAGQGVGAEGGDRELEGEQEGEGDRVGRVTIWTRSRRWK